MDLHERRQLDMAAQMARVKARTRPWRSIIALLLALASLAAAELGRHQALGQDTAEPLKVCGSVAFFLFGTAASFGLSGQARTLLQPVIGAAHASVVRYALVLVGIFTALVVALDLSGIAVGQLVLGGAVTGVLLGIAAQQSLANLFAGMVLLFARPFRVGDRVRLRAGVLGGGGMLEGTVTDVSITYVRLETTDGPVLVPNSVALASSVGPIPPPQPGVLPTPLSAGAPLPPVAPLAPAASPAPVAAPLPAAPPVPGPPADER